VLRLIGLLLPLPLPPLSREGSESTPLFAPPVRELTELLL